MGLDILQLLVLALAVVITGISKSGFAGGLGVITVPILSLVMSPILAAALMLPTLLIMDALSVRAWWGKFNIHLLKVLLPFGVLGVLIGYLTYAYINEHQVKFILGVITLIFGVNGLFGKKFKKSFSDNVGRILGTVSGFTSFVSHAGGPPLNFYLLTKKLAKPEYLGSAVIFFAVINFSKIFPYAAIGQFTVDNIILALLFSPISFLGVKLGVFLQGKINEPLFFKIIYVLLICLGVTFVMG